MSSKELQKDINSQTVKNFRQLLAEKKDVLIGHDIRRELSALKDFLESLEDSEIEKKSITAAKELSQMTEVERRMLLMTPDEKKFFKEFKARNPDNPWAYFKEYQKALQKKYKSKQKELS